MKRTSLISMLLCLALSLNAQHFLRKDTLRGTITEERIWWDLEYYHLEIEVLPKQKSIIGKNTIRYEVLAPHQRLQIDLQQPLKITKVLQDGAKLDFESEENAHFISLLKDQQIGEHNEIEVYYEGKPRPAFRAPWDGGFSWKKDNSGTPFIATSCQGLGASVWWPCKDHMYDEVDSMLISVEVPDYLVDVSNGRLRSVEHNTNKKTSTYHWAVVNPINNYGVNLNIGNYMNWNEKYQGEKGSLDVSYWVLKQDEEKARKQFRDVPRMLEAFEYWFGPFPFYEDGYQLVQAPYLGMEHQSSITYGNQFMNGYLGQDLSGTGWGYTFDYIIIHESGHEWFANSITYQDIADMWIHEGFTNYSEGLYVEYFFGKDAGQEYIRGLRHFIQNEQPMIGPYGVNYEDTPGDVYSKGANLLNTLRTIIDNDEQWRNLLRSIGHKFYHQTINSAQLENYIAQFFGMNLTPFFDQYLRDARLPVVEYFFKGGKLFYRATNCNQSFKMPLRVSLGSEEITLDLSTDWSDLKTSATELSVDSNYYIDIRKSR